MSNPRRKGPPQDNRREHRGRRRAPLGKACDETYRGVRRRSATPPTGMRRWPNAAGYLQAGPKSALVFLISCLALLAACGGPGYDKPMQLGGRLVQPETLNRGRDIYNRFCATCHGYDGKAETAQARQLDPRPRDMTKAEFKRVATPGALPSDSELSTLIQNGIPGTGMPAWPQLLGDDLDALVQYLKTFSPRWNSEVTPAPKKSEQGSMNVLPVGNDAASFRAASRATPVKGQPLESALAGDGQHPGPTGMGPGGLETERPSPEDEGVGAIAARTPPVQPPHVAR